MLSSHIRYIIAKQHIYHKTLPLFRKGYSFLSMYQSSIRIFPEKTFPTLQLIFKIMHAKNQCRKVFIFWFSHYLGFWLYEGAFLVFIDRNSSQQIGLVKQKLLLWRFSCVFFSFFKSSVKFCTVISHIRPISGP